MDIFAALKDAHPPYECTLKRWARDARREEAAIIRKIKRLNVPPKAWLAFLLHHSSPTTLSAFVPDEHRVGIAQLAAWHEQAVDGERIALAEHLGLPKRVFGKVVLERPKETA